MSTRLVTLATFPSPIEAEIARNVLAEAGVGARVEDMAASFWGGMFGSVKLLVEEADLDRADELLERALGDPLEGDEEPIDDGEKPIPSSEFAENLADRSPGENEPGWKCAACGVNVPLQEIRCWSCGASRNGDVNPYYIRPESVGPPAVAPERLAPHELPEHLCDLIDRAWRAACLSPIFFPPLFNFYSAWLLLLAADEAPHLSPNYNRKYYMAIAINLIVTGVSIVMWMALWRSV